MALVCWHGLAPNNLCPGLFETQNRGSCSPRSHVCRKFLYDTFNDVTVLMGYEISGMHSHSVASNFFLGSLPIAKDLIFFYLVPFLA
jgi:hypothetical protein